MGSAAADAAAAAAAADANSFSCRALPSHCFAYGVCLLLLAAACCGLLAAACCLPAATCCRYPSRLRKMIVFLVRCCICCTIDHRLTCISCDHLLPSGFH